jgi:hypothetical protein
MTESTGCTTTCPFTHGPCTDCAIYRGRHHYLMFSDRGNGVDQTKELISAYFKGMEKSSDPWAEKDDCSTGNLTPDLLMKLIDSEG